MRWGSIFLSSLTALLIGCTMAPKYNRPGIPVPSTLPDQAAAAHTQEGPTGLPSNIPWREVFADSKLQSLIEMALANNRDLRMAALNVEKARALYRIQRSQLYPDVGIVGVGDRYRLPEKMSVTGRAETVEQYSVGVGATAWELDLFGRVRSLKVQALNEYLATDQARVATQTSLVAAVADGYLAWAADREILQLAKSTLESQEAYYQLVLQRREAGISSDLDLSQARSQTDAAQVEVARYTGFSATDEHALQLLIGSPIPAGLVPVGLANVKEPTDIDAGLPSEVLLNRPDILQAEYQLKAANANIGAARANFFPRITLTGSIGSMSTDLSDLFKSGSGTWNFAPQVFQPIFGAGNRLATLRASKVQRDIAVAHYEKVIQTAFREVSDALVLRSTLSNQEDAQRSLVESLATSFNLSEARFRAGMDSYLSVLIAQRELYAAQGGLVSIHLSRETNRVELYRALGGGR